MQVQIAQLHVDGVAYRHDLPTVGDDPDDVRRGIRFTQLFKRQDLILDIFFCCLARIMEDVLTCENLTLALRMTYVYNTSLVHVFRI
jgi:hypothetical protein